MVTEEAICQGLEQLGEAVRQIALVLVSEVVGVVEVIGAASARPLERALDLSS